MTAERVVIVGQGYVGLPLAVRAVEVGFDVVGYDLDSARIGRLRAGDSYVEDVPADKLAAALESGRFTVTDQLSAVEGFDVVVITVPTPLRDGAPDLSYIEASARDLSPYLRPGVAVILESTTYPGTTEELLIPLLESGSKLKAGTDFHVGYSPERIDPGNTVYRFENTPKVVSGTTPQGLDRIAAFYEQLVVQAVRVPGPKEAELSKLLENTFRHVNIALVNELAVFAAELDIDIWAVIEAANTKPFGYMKFTPGPGVGGHCLPIDPSYLSWRVKRSLGHSFRFVELANDINEHMPDHVVERITRILNDLERSVRGSRILLVGLAYKPDSGDSRETPVLAVAEKLHELGGLVTCADSWVDPDHFPASVRRVDLTPHSVAEADLVVVLTNHSDTDLAMVAEHSKVVFDTRNAVQGPNVVKL
ncbi:MAG: nucleotide sugar dehydrogenase [Acidimicrobiales bacterium]|nr:nucleotide sugar dehydrogenase [Acidimicrobiales bacterium]